MTSRTRTQNPPDVKGYYYHYMNGNPYSTHGPYTMDGLFSEMMDVVTPNYHKEIAKGRVINNPCSYTINKVSTPGNGTYAAYRKSDGVLVYTGNGLRTQTAAQYSAYALGDHLSLNTNGSVDRAKLRAIANIDSTPYAFMEDAVELRKTLEYLKNPVRTFGKLAKDFQKDRKISASSKTLSQLWLEYRFAFTPTVRSMMELTEIAHEGIKRRSDRRSSHGRDEISDSDEETDILKSPFEFSRSRESTYSSHASILYEVNNPLLNAIHANLGFRVKDVPTTIWAVMPYSWLIDRVVNISNFITGITNLLDPNVTILAASVTTKHDRKTTDVNTGQQNGDYTVQINGDPVTRQDFDYNRTPWSPSVLDTIPTVELTNLVSSATFITDLLALARQRLR